MPWKSDKQRRWGHTAEGIKSLGGKSAVAEWDAASKKKKKPKMKVVVNNKIKAYGQVDVSKKKRKKLTIIEVNKKKHKGNKAELADTIKHEMEHVKHPNASEKTIHASTPAHMSQAEQDRLVAKLRMKKLNYKSGAAKRRFKMGPKQTNPGDLISKMNESKRPKNKPSKSISKTRLAIMGLM